MTCLSRWSEKEIKAARSVLSDATGKPLTRNSDTSSNVIEDIIRMFRDTAADGTPTFVDAEELVKSIDMIKTELENLRNKFESRQARTSPVGDATLRVVDNITSSTTTPDRKPLEDASIVLNNTSQGHPRITFVSRNVCTKLCATVRPFKRKMDDVPPLVTDASPASIQLHRSRNRPSFQRLPSMLSTPGPSTSPAAPAPMQRAYIWSGVLEWMEKGKAPGEQKVTKLLPCQVSANSKDIEPELKVDTWPNKLLMQLMPKQLISNIGGQYLKDSKSVLFHLQPNEALDALTKVMVNGFAGCVHFSSPPQCDIKVLILLYTPDKKAYLGFIPNNQATFVDRLRKVIQQQKITQIINKQMPAGSGAGGSMAGNMPTATMTGSGAMQTPGMSSAGMGTSGMSGAGGMGQVGQMGQVSQMGQVGQPGPGPSQAMGQQQVQQHQQNMMMSGGVGGGGGGGGGVGMGANINKGPARQLDGLEAARQQNLEKIQHLQQTLEAAHQQEAQFKSQMDIMSHLHAAQQQELNYKQLEEQQRKHQLQQQLQQLRGAGAAHPPRVMRPMMPSNPGLRHLLQQQPQYRPGGGGPRPNSQTQQFDDVNNYDYM